METAVTATAGRSRPRRLLLGVAGGLLLLALLFWEGRAPAQVLTELRRLMEVAEPPAGSTDIQRTYPLTWGVRTDFILSFARRDTCGDMVHHYRSVLSTHGFWGEQSSQERDGTQVTTWKMANYCASLRCIPPSPSGLDLFTVSVSWRRTRIGGCP